MSARPTEDLIQDMLGFARETNAYVEGLALADFVADKGLRRRVERTVELLGEAAIQLGDDVPDIGVRWGAIKALRTILLDPRQAQSLRAERLFTAATVEVPEILRRLEAHLAGGLASS